MCSSESIQYYFINVTTTLNLLFNGKQKKVPIYLKLLTKNPRFALKMIIFKMDNNNVISIFDFRSRLTF